MVFSGDTPDPGRGRRPSALPASEEISATPVPCYYILYPSEMALVYLRSCGLVELSLAFALAGGVFQKWNEKFHLPNDIGFGMMYNRLRSVALQ